MIWGAIFDWDGVVVDSSSHHERSWELLAPEIGKKLPEGHFKRGFGMKNEIIISDLLGWTHNGEEIERWSLRKEELFRVVLKERGIEPLAGVVTWLRQLRENGIPCVVGSSTHRLNIETALQVLGLDQFFSSIVSAEDVHRGKPDPEVFLTAAKRLELPPERCVVFEDAFVGIEAAHRGGMKVIAVPTTNPLESLGAADLVVKRLDELSIDQVVGLLRLPVA